MSVCKANANVQAWFTIPKSEKATNTGIQPKCMKWNDREHGGLEFIASSSAQSCTMRWCTMHNILLSAQLCSAEQYSDVNFTFFSFVKKKYILKQSIAGVFGKFSFEKVLLFPPLLFARFWFPSMRSRGPQNQLFSQRSCLNQRQYSRSKKRTT